MPATSLSQVVSLCKRRGFIFPGSEIYGGLANTWDYGPLGVELKNRVKRQWWDYFVRKRMDMVGLDASILMNSKTWEASGHVGAFADPLVDCKKCNERFRADKLIEEFFNLPYPEVKADILNYTFASAERKNLRDRKDRNSHEMDKLQNIDRLIQAFITKHHRNDESPKAALILRRIDDSDFMDTDDFPSDAFMSTKILKAFEIQCQKCGSCDWTESRNFNLMFKTHQGVVEEDAALVYLRPETAQGIFVNFKNILDTTRLRLPFGVAQIGKAFRNEITPGNFTFRTREFEQMEIEYFVEPGTDMQHFAQWQEQVWNWYLSLGIEPERLRIREHGADELSHYSSKTIDIEYHFPWGWGELFGLANRGDFDLKQHEEFSGEDLKYTDPDEPTKKFRPSVVEPSFGCDRSILTLLLEAYTEETLPNGEARTVMKFAPGIAPIDVAILPLSKKEQLIKKAKELYTKITQETNLNVDFDITGSIGKRYRRQDEVGTPQCITVDFGTVGEDSAQGETDTVTIRDRDTLEQERLSITALIDRLAHR